MGSTPIAGFSKIGMVLIFYPSFVLHCRTGLSSRVQHPAMASMTISL